MKQTDGPKRIPSIQPSLKEWKSSCLFKILLYFTNNNVKYKMSEISIDLMKHFFLNIFFIRSISSYTAMSSDGITEINAKKKVVLSINIY